jgi:isopenicillin N synthase-like dioxygenase
MRCFKRSLTRSSATAELDLDALAAGGAARAAALATLLDAANGSGAFLIHGSSIDWELARAMRDLARRLFRLPAADLAAIAMANSPHFRGYTSVGSERTGGTADLREQVDFAPERTPDPRAHTGPAYWRLPGPNQWPAALPELRPALLRWIAHLHAIARDLTAAIAEALGVPPDALAAAVGPDAYTRLKIVRYPGMPDGDAQGVGMHRDSGVLTIILDDGAGGLFVREGERDVPVRAPEGALVVVLGRTLERATSGVITAASHRVVSPLLPNERISIPCFFSPPLDYIVAPLALPAAIATRAHARDLDSADAGTSAYGESALNVLLRSHPAVAERHHRDLVSEPSASMISG